MPELAVPLRSLLDQAAGELRQAGVPESRRQATRLWVELSGAMDHWNDRAVQLDQAEAFRTAARRLTAGEPFPYVTGWAGFRHLRLRSDRRALIPRPETEGLVELLLHRVRQGIVADIGTGTGCIALSLALEANFSRVVGVDASSDALALARTNATLTGLARVDLVRGDLCAPLRGKWFSALISNPPYLTEREYGALDSSVRDWEPGFALRSGSDGLEATVRLIRQGLEALEPGGWLALEVDCSRAGAAAQLAVEHGWSDVSIHRDLFGRERYLLGRRSDTR